MTEKKPKIKTELIKYYGYRQGYKVRVDDEKFPKEHGHFYTTFDEKKAVRYALKERRKRRKRGRVK